MFNPIKFLEEKPVHIIIVYSSRLPEDLLKKITSFMRTQALRSKKYHVVIHVFTEREKPLYLADLRSLIQSIILLTITIRYYPLDTGMFEKLINDIKDRGEEFYVFIEEETKKIFSIDIQTIPEAATARIV